MNLHEVTSDDGADILVRSKVLHTWETADGMTVHVIDYAGNEALLIGASHGTSALVVEANDSNYGGSIHSLVRCARSLKVL